MASFTGMEITLSDMIIVILKMANLNIRSLI